MKRKAEHSLSPDLPWRKNTKLLRELQDTDAGAHLPEGGLRFHRRQIQYVKREDNDNTTRQKSGLVGMRARSPPLERFIKHPTSDTVPFATARSSDVNSPNHRQPPSKSTNQVTKHSQRAQAQQRPIQPTIALPPPFNYKQKFQGNLHQSRPHVARGPHVMAKNMEMAYMNPTNFTRVDKGTNSGAKPHAQMQIPRKNDSGQNILSDFAQALQSQGPFTGWRAEVTVRDRTLKVHQMITSLRLIQPQLSVNQAAQAAINFEQKVFKEASQKADYHRKFSEQLVYIRDTRARQAAVMQGAVMEPGLYKGNKRRGEAFVHEFNRLSAGPIKSKNQLGQMSDSNLGYLRRKDALYVRDKTGQLKLFFPNITVRDAEGDKAKKEAREAAEQISGIETDSDDEPIMSSRGRAFIPALSGVELGDLREPHNVFTTSGFNSNHRQPSSTEPRFLVKNTISEDHSHGLEADRLGKLRVLSQGRNRTILHGS